MYFLKSILVIFLLLFFYIFLQSQEPNDAVWGVYASGVGERLKSGMDPCMVTYTVAWVGNDKISKNIEIGLMGVLFTNVTWHQATAAQRQYSQYFDDQPDGIYKLSPCHVPPVSYSGVYATAWGDLSLSHNGNNVTGTYPHRNGRISGTLKGNVLAGTWQQDGDDPKTSWGYFEFTFSKDGNSFSGKWRYNSSQTWKNDWTGRRK